MSEDKLKFTVKTLNGEVLNIEADVSDRVITLKEKLYAINNAHVVERQKLIYSGKVLNDEQSVGELGLKNNESLVLVVTKDNKAKPASVAAPVAAPAMHLPAPVAAPVAAAPVPVPVAISPPAVPTPAQELNAESVANLVSMGFVEGDVRAALTASMGNADLAYDFLLSGIPEHLQRQTQPAAAAAATASTEGSLADLESLRLHPQFNQLRQLIQSNPASLPQVLQLLGQQNPRLLAAITSNEQAFLAMMNEPITATPAVAAGGVPTVNNNMAGAAAGLAGMDPTQMMQMLATLPADQRNQLSASLGMSPEQLQGLMQMISMMPPDQMQQLMGQAGGMGAAGHNHGAGGVPPGAHVIRLTEEESAAVGRLSALGYSQQRAYEAYCVCDHNEEHAANYLMDNGNDDGFDGGYDGGFDGDDGDDDMYN